MARRNDVKSIVDATCRTCGRPWKKQLLCDYDTLSDTAKGAVKRWGECPDCREIRKKNWEARMRSQIGGTYSDNERNV